MQDGKWTADSNECFEIVVRKGQVDQVFPPAFTHSLFEEETIFGYEDLQVQLHFGAATLRQALVVDYAKKHNKADDIEGALFEHLSKDYSTKLDDFHSKLAKEEPLFKPAGKLVASYSLPPSDKKGKGKAKSFKMPEIINGEEQSSPEGAVVYEAYSSTWQTKGWTDWHRRMKIFNTLLIDGASDIDEDDPSWSFLTLFERNTEIGTYAFVGFVSLFAFFYFSPSLSERRQKLAQFFILPPFQGQGHGAALYAICRRQALSDPVIAEFAVEDPSEAFEDLRDKSDLTMLRSDDAFNSAALSDPKADLESLRRRLKLASRQFYRLLEMRTLRDLQSNAPARLHNGKGKKAASFGTGNDDDEATRAFRLAVKKRLYLFNKDTLDQVDADERKEKLQQAYENVVEHYGRILASLS